MRRKEGTADRKRLTQYRPYGTLVAEVGEVFPVPSLFLAPLSPAALERMKENYFA
jgi:hypothetical protein